MISGNEIALLNRYPPISLEFLVEGISILPTQLALGYIPTKGQPTLICMFATSLYDFCFYRLPTGTNLQYSLLQQIKY